MGENARADCLDSSGTWYAATVLERKEVVEGKGNRDVVMLKVGYRVYDEHGPKKDALGRTFFGWSANFDEWISSHSLRIQKPGSLARKGLLKCNKNEDEDDKKHLDDAGDVLLNSLHGKETFAVLRPDKSRSEILVDLLNAFGRASGFESILSKLTCRDKEKLISIGKSRLFTNRHCVILLRHHRTAMVHVSSRICTRLFSKASESDD